MSDTVSPPSIITADLNEPLFVCTRLCCHGCDSVSLDFTTHNSAAAVFLIINVYIAFASCNHPHDLSIHLATF